MDYISEKDSTKFLISDGEKKQILLRQKVNELYFKYGRSKTQISKKEGVSKKFVIKWTQSPMQDFGSDDRGWPKGEGRLYGPSTVKKIKQLHKRLTEDAHNYFYGASAVLQQWRHSYPDQAPPSLRTIGRIMKQEGLTKSKRPRVKGASAYLCYPEHTVYEQLGGRVLEADFIGKKYIDGSNHPVNFIGFSFKKAPRIRYYQRIEAQTADCFIEQAGQFFEQFEKPGFIKVDNCLATIGSASGKRNLSRTMLFLFSKEVNPIFSVPRKPFTQASIEGNNSVFSRHFWNRRRFKSLEHIDTELQWFNQSSLRYTGYKKPDTLPPDSGAYTPTVYFLRQVLEDEQHKGYIDVLNEKVNLENSLINYYVLAKWNIKDQLLKVYLEKEKKQVLILELTFPVNKNSMKKLIQNSNLSFGT